MTRVVIVPETSVLLLLYHKKPLARRSPGVASVPDGTVFPCCLDVVYGHEREVDIPKLGRIKVNNKAIQSKSNHIHVIVCQSSELFRAAWR